MPPVRIRKGEGETVTKEERMAATVEPLLDWYASHKRNLPWRNVGDPYRVWVSEIMLQQTRVAAVLAYYKRWMDTLPTVADLAAAEEDTLMRLWQGLGYYSRVRNLQKAAKEIMARFDGAFPSAYEALLTLPGIGDYTAGAIASIAFGQPVPAVDGNALRVTARIADIEGNVLDGKTRREIRALLAQAIPQNCPGAFNQAWMDLGAMVCLAGKPACLTCPLVSLCEGYRLGVADSLPVRAKKPPRRVEEWTVFVLLQEGRAAFRKRPETGLLAGLWEPPCMPGILDEREAAAAVASWHIQPLAWREKRLAKHIFSHVEWQMTGYVLTVQGAGSFRWARPGELAVPSAFRGVLEPWQTDNAGNTENGL